MRFPYNASTVYEPALEAKRAFEEATHDLQDLFHCPRHRCVFTSGGTEGNNTALLALLNHKKKGVLWVSSTAHPSMLKTAQSVQKHGWELQQLPTTASGTIDLSAIEQLPKPDIIASEWINSEVGFIQPIEQICQWAREQNALTWVDGVQGIGKSPLLKLENIDAFVISGHKCGSPIGIGAVMFSEKVKGEALMLGGGHQDGRRSGTLPVPLTLTLRDVVRAAIESPPQELPWPKQLKRHRHQDTLYSPHLHLVDVSPVDGEILLHQLASEGILVGLGSACRAARKKPSEVHQAIGLSEQQSRRTLRISTVNGFDLDNWSTALKRIDALIVQNSKYFS
jgi:cysteine desulfurase